MSAHDEARALLRPTPGVISTLHVYPAHALRMIDEHDRAMGHLRALVNETPWSGDYDADWCHFCGARPDYGPKPWTGHHDGCVWLLANAWLTEHAEASPTESETTP